MIILPRQARDKHRESTQKKSGVSLGCVVQLQLRAEEVQSQRQEVELIRQRMVKLTGDGKTAGTLEVRFFLLPSASWTWSASCAASVSVSAFASAAASASASASALTTKRT
jgi:hypothetical protein